MVVAFVLYPVFTEAGANGALAQLDETDIAISNLRDKKAMLYDAIQDLDFEKAAGKVSDGDYENARNDYLAQVAEVIGKLDALAPPEPEAAPAATKTSSKKRSPKEAKDDPGLACANCGELNPAASNFCNQCGASMARTCASCGENLPAKARFCNGCGAKVSA